MHCHHFVDSQKAKKGRSDSPLPVEVDCTSVASGFLKFICPKMGQNSSMISAGEYLFAYVPRRPSAGGSAWLACVQPGFAGYGLTKVKA